MQSNRVDTNFLQKDNKQLRIQLKQAREVILLHKDALANFSREHHDSNLIKSLVSIILKENPSKYYINKLVQEIANLKQQKIMLQKVIKQIQQQNRESYQLLAQQLVCLQNKNKQLEKTLQNYQKKFGQIDYISELTTKYRELVEPGEQSMAFKKQKQELMQIIVIQQQNNQRLIQQKNRLTKINVYLKEQNQKRNHDLHNLSIVLANTTHIFESANLKQHTNQQLIDEYRHILADLDKSVHQQQIDNTQQNNNVQTHKSLINVSNPNISHLSLKQHVKDLNNTLNFIRMQHHIVKHTQNGDLQSSFNDSQEYNFPQLNILFPDKVESIQKNLKANRVPFLNMIKIREMMSKRQKQISKQIQKQFQSKNPTQKIIKLQTQLDINRKQLSNLTLKYKVMEKQIKQLKLQLLQNQSRNILLTSTVCHYQKNYRQSFRQCLLGRRLWSLICRNLGCRVQQYFNTLRNIQNNQQIRIVQNILQSNELEQRQPSQIIKQQLTKQVNQLQKRKLKDIEQKIRNIFNKNSPRRYSRSVRAFSCQK